MLAHKQALHHRDVSLSAVNSIARCLIKGQDPRWTHLTLPQQRVVVLRSANTTIKHGGWGSRAVRCSEPEPWCLVFFFFQHREHNWGCEIRCPFPSPSTSASFILLLLSHTQGLLRTERRCLKALNTHHFSSTCSPQKLRARGHPSHTEKTESSLC